MSGHVPQNDDDNCADQHRRNRSRIRPENGTDYCAYQRSTGIEMLHQHIWRAAGKDITKDAAADTGDDPHENGEIGVGRRNMNKCSLNAYYRKLRRAFDRNCNDGGQCRKQ